MKRQQDTADRLAKILKGAFAGPPTQLKDIPTRVGLYRGTTRTKTKKKRAAARNKTVG